MNRPAIMGILNITPDSFSGDGVDANAALERARRLMDEGADIIDIGAESTRPNAMPLTAEEEWARLAPLLNVLGSQMWRDRVRFSVDTRHAETASRVLALGIEILNDVGGLNDEAMMEALEEHECDIVVMHALTIPVDPTVTLPPDCDVVAEILRWKTQLMARAKAHGIGAHRLIYDPGIGFGKTAEQSLALIERAAELKKSGGRWLFGHSRKSFMKLVSDAPAEARDELTRSYSKRLAESGVDYLRVHDVLGHVRMFDSQ